MADFRVLACGVTLSAECLFPPFVAFLAMEDFLVEPFAVENGPLPVVFARAVDVLVVV
jgi:hypothetical protein